MFAFIVAIATIGAASCAGNDTISTMVTRRSTHARHVRPGGKSTRSSHRRDAAPKTSYAGVKKNGRSTPFASSLTGTSKTFAKSPRTRSTDAERRRANNTSCLNTNSLDSSPHVIGSSKNRPSSQGAMLLSRRHFLIAAVGVGVLATVGGGASVLMSKSKRDATANSVSTLQVPSSSLTSLDSSNVIEDTSSCMSQIGRYELPYGTLVWASDPKVAACLLPNDNATPLAKVGILSLSNGSVRTVLNKAEGQSENFEIFEARATSSGLIWIEANIFDLKWRIYTARSDGASIEKPLLVDEGDENWETPSIAATGNFAVWQIMPKTTGNNTKDDSLVKCASFGSSNADTVYTSHGRLATAPYPINNTVVITPRTDTANTYYQLTRLDLTSSQVLDSLVLPHSMRPLEAGYGNTGFMFSFDAPYDYEDGISNLGTYAPCAPVSDGNYSNALWYCFSRVPTAAPTWCGNYFMVKSSLSVCGVNMNTNEYFALQPEDGASNYGEFLASTGADSSIVTYANIDYRPIEGEAKKYCVVRVWKPAT